MPHPPAYDDADPLLQRVRAACLALPGVSEQVAHGRPTFRCPRMFVVYGGGRRTDAGHVRHPHALLFVPDPAERPGLEADGRFFAPAYLGPSGWLALDLDQRTDWAEVEELIESAYRTLAPPRQVAALDARQG